MHYTYMHAKCTNCILQSEMLAGMNIKDNSTEDKGIILEWWSGRKAHKAQNLLLGGYPKPNPTNKTNSFIQADVEKHDITQNGKKGLK